LDILSTSTFREAKDLLIKRPENGYGSCCKDICDALTDLTFDDIYNLHFLIRETGDIRIIKVRLKNSFQKIGSSSGYRLIILGNKKYNHIALLKIYPKRGKYGQSDLRDFEYKELLKTYSKELVEKRLVLHNLNNDLTPIV